MSKESVGVVALKTDEGTVLLMNLDHKDVQDAFSAALAEMKRIKEASEVRNDN